MADIDTTYLDSDTDSIKAARPALLDVVTRFNQLISGIGSSLVGFTQVGTGTIARTLQSKLSETVSLKDFGAIGDGVANDTAAISAAVSYLASSGNNVIVTPGVYLTDTFSMTSQVYAGQAGFIGSDRDRCIFKRRTSGYTSFITYGSPSSTVYQSGIGFEGITIDGGATSNGDAFTGYDIVRSQFRNVRFTGGSVACHLLGGVSISFYSCLFDMAAIGLRVEKFTSLAGGGWPNIIRVIGGEVVDNSVWGAYFDDGRMFTLEDVEIEGNGTTLGAQQGGVYIGANVGTEVTSTDTHSIVLTATGCWFEANRGVADVSLNNGINLIANSNFFSSAAMTTNDVLINAGRYTLRNVNMSMSKTANVLEGVGSVVGNTIESSDIPNITYTSSKTSVYANNKINLRGGVVPAVGGVSTPFIQQGNSATGSGSGVDITFITPYATTPQVFLTVSNGVTSTQLTQGVVSTITPLGFHLAGVQINSGSNTVGTANISVNWLAIGSL